MDDVGSFFHETFSQLGQSPISASSEDSIPDSGILNTTSAAPKLPLIEDKLEEFEEAFTALKSIQTAHEPLSYTSINAFLHSLRGSNT